MKPSSVVALLAVALLALPSAAARADGPGPARLATHYHHTCAATTAGVTCWGSNVQGQLGDGTTITGYLPVTVSGLGGGVAAVAAGGYGHHGGGDYDGHSCAVTAAGGVKCWGANALGQLGDGTTTSRLTPVDVTGLSSGVVAVTAGDQHTCALTVAGGVKCWGSGELGDGRPGLSPTPVDALGLTSGVVHIAAGGRHTCALMAAGGVKCWGINMSGQLGIGVVTMSSPVPVDVIGLPGDVIAVTAGAAHTCAMTGAGAVACWGANSHGQLGDGSFTSRPTPGIVFGLASGAVAVSGGGYHSCAAMSTGSVKCWGTNAYGQLGDGTTRDALTPVEVTGLTGAGAGGGFGGFVALAAGDWHSCGLTGEGAVICWGYNFQGQLGDGTRETRLRPVRTSGIGPPDTQAPQLAITVPTTAETYTASIGRLTLRGTAIDAMGVTWVTWATDLGETGIAQGTTAWSASVGLLPGPNLVTIRAQDTSGNTSFDTLAISCVPSGDITGDGRADILWQHADGWVGAWIMDGTLQLRTLRLDEQPAAAGWHVAGAADFSEDGENDILFQHDAGYLAVWIMRGTSHVANLLLDERPVAPGWHVRATGDLDGDGKADILWQDENGYVACWLMDGLTQRSSVLLDDRPVAADGWRLAGAGDLDGDGMTDLLWQSRDGYLAAWIMSRLSPARTALLYAFPVATDGWTVAADADMNGDGLVDLLWQKLPTHSGDTTFGWVAVWLMNGLLHAASVLLTPPRVFDAAWTMVGPK